MKFFLLPVQHLLPPQHLRLHLLPLQRLLPLQHRLPLQHSSQKKFLESQGEGIHHIAFIVDDIKEATSIMIEAGFKVISSSNNEGGGGMAFFDTDKVGGVQIELEELPPHLYEDRYWGLKPWSK